jgi:hypothetical protein
MYRLRGTPASSNRPDQLDLDRVHLQVTSDANGPRHGTSRSLSWTKSLSLACAGAKSRRSASWRHVPSCHASPGKAVIQTDGACTERNDLKQATRHHDVLRK